MRVKMLTVSAGPSGILRVGDIADVPDGEAALLIERKYAEAVESKAPPLSMAMPDEAKEETPLEAIPKKKKPKGTK